MMECEGRNCLRAPIRLSGLPALAWEMFCGPAADQWTESGRYDYGLAIKLFECFGLEPPDILSAVDNLAIIVRETRKWLDLERDNENHARENEKAAKEALDKL